MGNNNKKPEGTGVIGVKIQLLRSQSDLLGPHQLRGQINTPFVIHMRLDLDGKWHYMGKSIFA